MAAYTKCTAGIDDLATSHGYTAGGNAASLVSASQSGGVYSLVLNSPAAWVSNTGNVGPFRYAVLWDATTGSPIGFWDYGTSITLDGVNGDSFEVLLGATVFTVS